MVCFIYTTVKHGFSIHAHAYIDFQRIISANLSGISIIHDHFSLCMQLFVILHVRMVLVLPTIHVPALKVSLEAHVLK